MLAPAGAEQSTTRSSISLTAATRKPLRSRERSGNMPKSVTRRRSSSALLQQSPEIARAGFADRCGRCRTCRPPLSAEPRRRRSGHRHTRGIRRACPESTRTRFADAPADRRKNGGPRLRTQPVRCRIGRRGDRDQALARGDRHAGDGEASIGTPAEEGGQRQGLPRSRRRIRRCRHCAFHWHAGDSNSASAASTSLANRSAKFRFRGQFGPCGRRARKSAHARRLTASRPSTTWLT